MHRILARVTSNALLWHTVIQGGPKMAPFCEMSSVLKATIENQTISVTKKHILKKLTTGNNVFIVSVIVKV